MRKLHDLAGRDQAALRLLARHHHVREPRRQAMACIVLLGSEFCLRVSIINLPRLRHRQVPLLLHRLMLCQFQTGRDYVLQ